MLQWGLFLTNFSFNIAERISESLFNYFNEQGLSNNSLRLSKSMKKGLEAGNLILHE